MALKRRLKFNKSINHQSVNSYNKVRYLVLCVNGELYELYEGPAKSSITKELFVKATYAIFMYETSLKRSISCGNSDMLHKDNHIFLHCEK